MKLFLQRICIAAVAGTILLAPAATRAETDAETAAHRSALDLAGAFTNEGFKLRDGDFAGNLKPGQSVVVQVNLYAGNQYWFTLSSSDSKTALSINLYDESGKLLKTDTFATQAVDAAKQAKASPQTNPDPDATTTNRTAAGFAPDVSGPYYVNISNPSSSSTVATYCLIYSYK